MNTFKKYNSKKFKAVESIGISGQMHGATLIDKNDKILRKCILWNDTRSIKECFELEKKFPLLRKESGNIAMPGFTSPKLLWINRNEKAIFKKIHKVLLPKDYLRLKLTGNYCTDMSDASGTLWLNVKKRKWSEGLIEASNLTLKNMPDLVEGNEVSGFVLNSFLNEFGFDKKVFVAGGAGDQAAGAIGSGVTESNQSIISLGTSGVYFSPTSKFSSNTNQAVHSFCHCLKDTWHHMSVMLSATNCLNWFCNLYGIDIKKAENKAKKYFLNSIDLNKAPYFFPYLTGERTPYNNSHLRGSFHMIHTSTSIESMFYSIIEGISFGIKDGFQAVHKVSTISEKIYLIGGGSKSIFWANLLSSILNQKIIVGEGSDLGPALGAARLGMLSTNQYKKNEVIVNLKKIKECSPSNYLTEKLEKRYKVWKKIVSVNEPIARNLIEISDV